MYLNQTFNFTTALKVTPTKGNLVYEYNPFYNYRLNELKIRYKDALWSAEEFIKEFCKEGVKYSEDKGFYDKEGTTLTTWEGIFKDSSYKTETTPVVYQKGQLTDFDTNELGFSLNNPVSIIPQYSYDNSVNLIINDGINPPRLINSRFSATEKNKYQVCDRKNDNDSNIYDQGDEFNVDTSLYKKITNIPELQFAGVSYGGNLKIGNYYFYFRYVDDDGNMSDFFAESGLVSIFIGNVADSIHSGFRNENSHKLVKFIISNTDPSYQEIVIYYTRATSDISENATVQACKIDRKYKLLDSGNTLITITGFEEIDEVDLSEINPTYQIYGSAETQEQCQNRLFLANVDRPQLPYEDLADCALRFLPYIDNTLNYPINQLGDDYSGSVSGTYYDPTYIYKKVGYHCDEIYRLGIVFILSDNTLSEVFNVRGTADISINCSNYSDIPFMQKDSVSGKEIRNYINFDEQYYNIITEGSSETLTTSLENAKGVIRIGNYSFEKVLGINFRVKQEVVDYLYSELGIKGFFFVRQKRIPTTLCQAYTIGIDNESHIPVIPSEDGKTYYAESFLSKNSITQHKILGQNISKESSSSRILTHSKADRIRDLKSHEVSQLSVGAICPEYDVNSPYLNSLFTGTEFAIKEQQSISLENQNNEYLHFKSKVPSGAGQDTVSTAKIIGVEDNVKLVAINDSMFSARAGEAEEAFRYEYLGSKKVTENADNLIRGSFGPYLGITKYTKKNSLINIKIPGYSEGNMQKYFEIRFHDKSQYYPISSRMDLSKSNKWLKKDKDTYILKESLYRGDCYICQFTHRLNRNFQDPSAPSNDQIVNPNCWKDNYAVSDGVVKKENFDKINLGDVNAVQLGMYITLFVRSSINLNIRAIDDSNADEIGMFGHPRGFYPYYSMTNRGSYKIPEALCYNKGMERGLSEKIFFEVPDVPWIKNEFSNRIAYSQLQVVDAFENGWRTFIGTHYRDYPKTYGSITKLIELRGNLLVVFEHGVGLIAVNERAVAGEGSGGNVYINTSNVLPENPKIISDTFGSQWRESVIKTPMGVYGVDTIGKKIWRTNGENFECISDFKVQQFLNKNISLTERELDPIIGVRNVKTHYNKFKHDVMFTFYDNLHGFEEKVWNICYNEILQKWITFYSWVPSYSENIYNQFFSFDRNTSKWVAKLGISRANNDFSDGVCLSNNEIPNTAQSGSYVGTLSLENRTLPSGDNVTNYITYTLERDNLQNYKYFKIVYVSKDLELSIGSVITGYKETYSKDYPIAILILNTEATNLCSELYQKGTREKDESKSTGIKYTTKITNIDASKSEWIENCVINSKYCSVKNEQGIRQVLETPYNSTNIVTLLNIKASVHTQYNGKTPDITEMYITGNANTSTVDSGYYESVVAVIPKYNKQFLTTDFWKHGQAGIIDISDPITPCYWYGKQHPFEFEFVVADQPSAHKIFDNLEIISNSAEPESFHYEIVGDCYDFAKDKKNMYIRQEATKHLYQYNGSDILFNSDYVNLDSEHRKNYRIQYGKKIELDNFDKSTLLPLYYQRRDSVNEIEDYYAGKTAPSKDYSALAGGEIVRDSTMNEYHIWNHVKAVDITDPEKGRLRGNMQYKEDKWQVQINPLNIVQKNEPKWTDLDGKVTSKVPVELNQNPLPSDVLNPSFLDIPEDFGNRGYVLWNWQESQMKEVKMKDKWIKIRIRYTGDKLAIISAINTLYSISYS